MVAGFDTVRWFIFVLISVPSKLKKLALFWTRANKNFENQRMQIWPQFFPQEKISQNKISLFLQKCVLHIFTI